MHALQFLGHEAGYVWHQETSLRGYDAVILPGGFSYGDYLRCGAVARFSPVMDEVVNYAAAGYPVMGICNGFQILAEAHLLPGALIRNTGLKFICQEVQLRIEQSQCRWISPASAGDVVRLPINHNEGNYICDPATLEQISAGGQVVLRYEGLAPNGALDNIAGVCNRQGNVFGLMPHPERVTDGISGNTDGATFFSAIVNQLQSV
jgi:phosphoribosylformylglycinamidine synthase